MISSGSFQHLTNFLNKLKNYLSPKYQANIVVLFCQLLSFNFNYCSSRKYANVFVIPCRDTAWTISVITQTYIKKSDTENLIFLFSSEKRKTNRGVKTLIIFQEGQI